MYLARAVPALVSSMPSQMCQAISIGHLYLQMECVRWLVEERGSCVNQCDRKRGWTPLHRAARMAHHTQAPYLAICKYLLQKGADATIRTKPGWSPDGTVCP